MGSHFPHLRFPCDNTLSRRRLFLQITRHWRLQTSGATCRYTRASLYQPKFLCKIRHLLAIIEICGHGALNSLDRGLAVQR